LVEVHKTWKSYQEACQHRADGVNVSDGYYTLGGPNAEVSM